MTDTMTSQSIDFSSWNTLFISPHSIVTAVFSQAFHINFSVLLNKIFLLNRKQFCNIWCNLISCLSKLPAQWCQQPQWLTWYSDGPCAGQLRVWFPSVKEFYLFPKMFKLNLVTTQAHVQWLSLDTKWLCHSVDDIPLSNAEVKNGWSCTSTKPCVILRHIQQL
jgi:hypothetical protein